MNRRLVLKQLAALAAISTVGPAAYAQRAGGQPFQTLPSKVPTESPGKVEVIEFFSYGCGACHAFEPMLNDWAKKLPSDVKLVKVPITFNNEQRTVLARVYYTLEAMGATDKHAAVYNALHERKVPLSREDVLFDWAASEGLDRKRFMDTYKSFGVQSKVQRANQIAGAYRVNVTPTMAVDGRYLASPSSAGSFDALLKTVDELIVRSRGEKGRG